jgi:hypothetical protein
MCSEVEAGNLETGVQRLTEHWQKFVEDVGEFEENSLINAEGVWNHPCKFNFYCSYVF